MPEKLAQRIESLGGDLAYIAIDESFGGNLNSNGCHVSMADAAEDAGSVFALYQNIFPAVQMGDNENLPEQPAPIWFSDYVE